LKRLILISTWFGPWPRWINFTMETCRWNPDIDWLLVTDQEPPENRPPNVRFVRMTLAQVLARIGEATELDLSHIDRAYKLCDLKPAYGHAFEAEIAGYASYGFADIDVFYGRIRHFYTDEVLRRYDVISTHELIVSGHLAVFRNTPRLRRSYRLIPKWRERAPNAASFTLDEGQYRRVFRAGSFALRAVQSLVWRCLFVERYSTWSNGKLKWWNDRPWPETWLWKDGRLTNTQDGDREYLYLHAMPWHSNRYRPDGTDAPWVVLGDKLVRLPWREIARTGFVVSPEGLFPESELPEDQARGRAG